MFRKLTTRTPFAVVAALLLLIGSIPAATAATAATAPATNGGLSEGSLVMVSTGTQTVSYSSGGVKRATMSFKDDGDVFTVCDKAADGAGVGGFLLEDSPYGLAIAKKEEDGGDAGCDSFTFDIKGGSVYYLRICWKGNGNCAKDYPIIE